MRGRKISTLLTTIIITISALFLFSCVQTPEQKLIDTGVTQATNQELKELTSQPISWKYLETTSKREGMTSLSPDGTYQTESVRGKGNGKWRVNNDTLCLQLEGQNEHCARYFKVAEGEYQVFLNLPNGKKRHYVSTIQ